MTDWTMATINMTGVNLVNEIITDEHVTSITVNDNGSVHFDYNEAAPIRLLKSVSARHPEKELRAGIYFEIDEAYEHMTFLNGELTAKTDVPCDADDTDWLNMQ